MLQTIRLEIGHRLRRVPKPEANQVLWHPSPAKRFGSESSERMQSNTDWSVNVSLRDVLWQGQRLC
jgi:hypothetical protein